MYNSSLFLVNSVKVVMTVTAVKAPLDHQAVIPVLPAMRAVENPAERVPQIRGRERRLQKVTGQDRAEMETKKPGLANS